MLLTNDADDDKMQVPLTETKRSGKAGIRSTLEKLKEKLKEKHWENI